MTLERLEFSRYAPGPVMPTKWQLRRWDWFGRFVGQPEPLPTFHVHVINGVGYTNALIEKPGPKVVILHEYTSVPSLAGLESRLFEKFMEKQ